MSAGRCRSCDAPVVWVPTKNGLLMPLDPKPVVAGNVAIIDGLAVVVGEAVNVDGVGPERYTCPGAAEHRRRR